MEKTLLPRRVKTQYSTKEAIVADIVATDPPDHGIPMAEKESDVREGCVYLILRGAKNQTVYNTFAYGVGSLLRAEDCKGIFLCNLGADNIAHPQMIYQNSEVHGVNIMRYNGSSYEIEGGRVSLYNRLTILDKHEENF